MNFSSQPSAENYCNVQAVQLGLDPVGTAYDFDDAFIIEMPLPWRKSLYERDGPLPHALLDLYDVWSAEYEAGKPYHHNSMLVAPDESAEQVEQDERRTVIFYERPIHPFAYFMKTEYRVPVEEIGQILWARYMQPEQMRQFERYRRAEFDRVRDILVCTHGSVDVACAKFGYPLYQMLRRTYHDEPEIRVWRVSHFGGHVFAPTLIDMPAGHYWAYVGEQQAEQIVGRRGDVVALNGHYRGWAGISDGLMQAAERAIWQQVGWEWFSYAKSGLAIEQDTNMEEPSWADIRIDYATPGGDAGHYTAHVVISNYVETISSTRSTKKYPHPQYAVTDLTHHSVQPVEGCLYAEELIRA